MVRFFNTAGPVDHIRHYCLEPLTRIELTEVLRLIEQEKYFVLHAPRQTGKTSCLKALMAHLNAGSRYRCLYVNFEAGQGYREQVVPAMVALTQEMALRAAQELQDTGPAQIRDRMLARGPENVTVGGLLSEWAAGSARPIVLLIDEIDSLVGDTLIAVLRQIRAGYDRRPAHFPQSVVLCGVRDVRDYRIHSDREKSVIAGGSAFNVRAESLRLGDFSRAETASLYAQHTAETGQAFAREAVDEVWELTQGQPWLVNALAYEACFRMRAGQERFRSISVELVQQARENLILRREMHLDQLADKLREERVRRVIEPLLLGVQAVAGLSEDDAQYVEDLGLVRRRPQLTISNPIYREIIPRLLTATTQETLVQEAAWYVRGDGRLDVPGLLTAFQQFFREHAESWLERFDYKEAGPQLLLQAFLQRIVNADGRIEREYGLGRRRTDLLVLWPLRRPGAGLDPISWQRVVFALKLLRGSLAATLSEGVAPTGEYMDQCGADEGHLLVFDRTPGKRWEEKIFRRSETYRGVSIEVWGM